MWSPTDAPSILKPTDIVSDSQKTSLDFSSMPNFAPKLIAKTGTTLINHALAKAELDKTLTEINEVSWLKKISNPTLYFVAKETDLRKNAISTHLKSTVEKSNEAQHSIDQAQAKLLPLKTDLTQVKQALVTFHQNREEAHSKIKLLLENINQNKTEIKAIEPILGSASSKIYYSMLAAAAIDPSLIKQAFDLKQWSLEYIILNRDEFINHTELFINASQLIQEGSASNNAFKKSLTDTLSEYEAIKKNHDAFKASLPSDLAKLTPEQATEAARLGEALRKSISEYALLKKMLNDGLEQAIKYVKYHDTWSNLTQEDMDTAKLIEHKKQENAEANKIIDNLMAENSSQKKALLTDKLLLIETEISAQEKIVFDHQLLLKTQQDFLSFFQQEAEKLELPLQEIPAAHESEIPSASVIPILFAHIPDISHVDI